MCISNEGEKNISVKREEPRHADSERNQVSGKSGCRLKVLVLDEEIPYPPNAGKRIRTWNLLHRLACRHSISLLCYGRPSDPAATVVQNAGITLHLVEPQADLTGWRLHLCLFLNLFSPYPFSVAKHFSSRFQRELQALLEGESWDLIQCEWTPYVRFVSEPGRVPLLVATHNVESQIWARRARHTQNPFAKVFFKTQEWKMRWFEKRALLRASATTAVTAPDVETLRGWGIGAITLVPNGADLEPSSPVPDVERENEILILASLDWYPNVDALEYFIKNIFPIVRTRRPESILRIVGRKPPESLKKWLTGMPGVDFVGEVENARWHLDRATVVIVPLRIGGGSRIKILEALAAGKAVVCTSIGAEGLDVVSGEHLIIADLPGEFALRVEELLASKVARRKLGNRGRNLVIDRYGWDGIARRLESVWQQMSRNPTAAESISSKQPEVQVAP